MTRQGQGIWRKVLYALALPALLAACSKADNQPGEGGVTVGEARALDAAADKVEAQSLPPEAAGSEGRAPG